MQASPATVRSVQATLSRKETTVPLHSTTISAVRMPRLARLAAIAATAATAGAVTIALTEDRPAPQVRTIGESAQPAASRYFDLEAHKAASMRALGRRIAAARTDHTSRYQDLEANKARSQSAR
jgi:hypothetical protein